MKKCQLNYSIHSTYDINCVTDCYAHCTCLFAVNQILRIGDFEILRFFWVGHFGFFFSILMLSLVSSKFLAMCNIMLYSLRHLTHCNGIQYFQRPCPWNVLLDLCKIVVATFEMHGPKLIQWFIGYPWFQVFLLTECTYLHNL